MAEDKGRGNCACCGKDCKITSDGKIWHHHPEGENAADCYSGPDSKRCKGAGELPAGAKAELSGSDIRFLCRVPSGPEGCGHQVQLTANRRARSHLTPQGTPCAEGGSAFPIAVGPDGYRADTAEWTEADWERVLPRPVRPDPNAPAYVAGDGRTPEQQAEIDRRRADPLGSALEILSKAFDPQDPDGPGEPEGGQATMELAHDGAGLFDVTHVLPTDLGPEVHPGEAAGCRLPGCCTHPHGFEYGDDDNGHSGSFCHVCGTEEDMRPDPSDWRCPPDILERMPEGVQELCATNPECWECGHEVTPLAERFEPDGSVLEQHVVWTCSAAGVGSRCPDICGVTPGCRPQASWEDVLGNLTEGAFFTRHTLKAPMDKRVYRVQGGSYDSDGPVSVTATVVSAGPYGGRTGDLTNLREEITCTDLNGTPRARRDPPPDPGTGGTLPSSLGPQPQPDPTPSAPARTTQARSSVPSSRPDSTPSAPPSAAPSEPSGRATTSGPTEKAAGSTPSAPRRTALPDAFSTARAEVSESDKYDRYGRYRLLHPDTGKKVAWTRATTFAKSIQDTFALSQWAQRMTLKGASLRPDIVAAVSTLEVKKDKDRVNSLVEDAKKAAGDKVAANLGTAVHSFTEDRDKTLVGMPVKDREVPEKLRPTVDAYEELIASFGLEPVPGLIEFTTAVKQYEICGTSDRVYRVTRDITFKLNGRTLTLYAGEYVVGDVKTGADLSYGWMEICIQLAIYAQGLNTSGVWDWGTGQWAKPVLPDNPEVLLKVRTDVAVVPHLPVDRKQGDPLATLYAIDLDEGWAAAVLCAQVRTVRKKAGSTLATALTVADVAEGDPSEPVQRTAARARPVISRPPTLEEKARAVTTQADASAVWQEAVAARTSRAEVDRLVEIMKKKLESHVEQGA